MQITEFLVKRAKQVPFPVYILPAISSLDCMLADLCINPGTHGMQLLEATELLAYRKFVDNTSHVAIFQVGSIGQDGHSRDLKLMRKGLELLFDYLSNYYSLDQIVFFYEASQYPKKHKKVIETTLQDMKDEKISSLTTIYLPPAQPKEIDNEMVKKIKLLSTNFDTSSKKTSILRKRKV